MSAGEAKCIAGAIFSVIPEMCCEMFFIVGTPNPFSNTDVVRFCKGNNSIVFIGRAHVTLRRSLIVRTRADLHDLQFVTAPNDTISSIVRDMVHICRGYPSDGKTEVRLIDDIPPWVWYADSGELRFITSKKVSRIVGLELKCTVFSQYIDILLDPLANSDVGR